MEAWLIVGFSLSDLILNSFLFLNPPPISFFASFFPVSMFVLFHSPVLSFGVFLNFPFLLENPCYVPTFLSLLIFSVTRLTETSFNMAVRIVYKIVTSTTSLIDYNFNFFSYCD